jgi:hypothetical protein
MNMRAKTYLKYLYRGMLCLLATIFLVGCNEIHRGHYQIAKVPGWTNREVDGISDIRYPTKEFHNKWHIFFRGFQKGKLHLQISTDRAEFWKKVTFSGQAIIVAFQDKNKEAVIPAGGFQSPFGCDIEVGDSEDFTVIIPSFKIGDSPVPQSSVRVRWSDKKYRIWIPIQ